MTMVIALILFFVFLPIAMGIAAAMLVVRLRLLALLPIGLFCFFAPSFAMMYAGIPLIVGMGAGGFMALMGRH